MPLFLGICILAFALTYIYMCLCLCNVAVGEITHTLEKQRKTPAIITQNQENNGIIFFVFFLCGFVNFFFFSVQFF